MEPTPPAVEAWSLNHWTPREVPNCTFLKDTIFDNVLENQMEHAPGREETVKAVLSLLKKKYIIML